MTLFDRLIVTTLPVVPRFIVGRFASRYVAGETRRAALDAVRELNLQGAMATLDVLGEEVTDREKALAAVEEYIGLFDSIEDEGHDANVSIKLTLVGLKIDEGFCRDNVRRIAEAAARHGNFLRIDMEDRTTTDATLRIYHELQPELGNLGVVLQSYMRRTLADIAALPRENANVRLCKGIYIEPRTTAWKGFRTVRRNFVYALRKLFEQGVYVGIATHDEYLVCAACDLIEKHGLMPDQYEFQMLLGVDEEMRGILLREGRRLRVYVPYGPDWYPYSIRRLRENPQIAKHVLRGMLRKR